MVEALLEQAPWLTPTFLFLLLNIVIATIFISSAFNHRIKNHNQDSTTAAPPYQQLARTPSLFSRVTSFNFSNYHPDQHHHQHSYSSSSFFSRVASFTGRADEPSPGVESTQDGNVELEQESKPSLFTRVTSFKFTGQAQEPGPDVVEDGRERVSTRKVVAREPYLLSRIASFSLRRRDAQVVEEVGEVDARRNVVIRDTKKKTKKKEVERKDEEVDAKADDFINRFKQQLKMQRVESLMRYRSA